MAGSRLATLLAVVLLSPGPSSLSPLPMTDYSQLNHDEPTHWTKPATTPTKEEVSQDVGGTRTSSTTAVSATSSLGPSVRASDSTISGLNVQQTSGTWKPTTGTWSTRPPVSTVSTTRITTQRPRNLASTISPTGQTHGANASKENVDITSEVASIEARDNAADREDAYGDLSDTTAKADNNTEGYYRYDIIEDIRNLFSNDNDNDNELRESQLEDVIGFKGEEKVPTEETLIVQRLEEGGYENYQEEEDRKDDAKKMYDALVVPTLGEKESPYETPFSDWDRESEEQEHALENIVFQASNESEVAAMDMNHGSLQAGSWFLLLLAGNSTIVQMRQKDFAKYLKLNLAARLSLDYDDLRVNKVVLAPPRLMVNVSVIPSETDNFDEEFDLNERLFGEEEAPLHKLAETNATLLELSGEEYHVVRFLSLRSAQPMTMEETSEAAPLTSEKHADIEYLIYIIVGGPCITVIIFLIYTLYRIYVLPRKIDWPWKKEKQIFSGCPRHQRMEEHPGPLKVIYSGSFVDRNGPPSGSWLDEHYQPPEQRAEAAPLDNPNYGLGSLSKTALSEICEPTVLDSPRFNVRMMGCQPGHLLLPHTPKRSVQDLRPPRLPKGLDNPNYLT